MKSLVSKKTASMLTLFAALVISSGSALADINVGVILSLTGSGASLGLPENDAVKLWPTEIAGQKLNVVVMNDSTDASNAARSASKLISEDKVDIIVGSSLTPPSLAILEIAAQNSTPMITLAGGSAIVEPVTGSRTWAFKLSPPERYAVGRFLSHMQTTKKRTVGVIAIATAYGEGFIKELERSAGKYGVKVLNIERYNPTDQTVTGQITKIAAARPDAVYIISAGTAGALPQIELNRRGYRGVVYQTQGVANNDFLRVGGKDVEGTYVTVAPVLVAEQLPEEDPIRKPAMEFIKLFEGKYGPGSRSLFAASAWDAYLLLREAAGKALKTAQPGTPAFRQALRDELEQTKNLHAAEAIYSFNEKDHNGVDERSQVLVRIENGKWKLVK